MGIKQLWKLLHTLNVFDNQSLRTLSITEGFEGPREDRLYRIGVDVSIWVHQLQQVFVRGHAQAGENPELRTFFYRLAMLAERPVHVVFVSDGPERPAIKRKTRVKTTPHWLLEGMQLLAEAFGYDWLQAAGEAEAELARMNQAGIIDAVLTEDSDALLFGALVVIRNPSFKRDDSDVVAIYRADEMQQAASLSTGDLLLLALLLGSDYDPNGLPRCGPTVAYGLTKYGLGRALSTAVQSMSDVELTAYLPTWRALLCDRLRRDPHGHIGRLQPSLAASVPATFPDVEIARLLLAPTVLDPQTYSNLRGPRPMDLPRLGQLSERYFAWGSRADILKTFRLTLWPGEAVRMLILDGLNSRGAHVEVGFFQLSRYIYGI
ncbi:PIN domain-like protein [Trametes coccinea BRFM310]|uniref:PIN domain-like protein n=1 Tax=Trametes coccinea (strain BRFM310) TaxID=1353009 RepID=A0A1Y2J227_TRAC3|nr:PIN domain-like protein [Trametes coccinea BRFM310]